MLNIFLPIIIIGLFISWYFVDWVGITGLGIIISFYWLLFFSGRRSSRQKLAIFKDQIIYHFSVFGSKPGQEHFKYIYDNAHYYLMAFASRGFSSTNSMITLGSLVIGIISIFRGDWYSVGACVIFYGLAATLSSKFNKPYFDLQAVKNEPMASFDTNYNLTGYANFFQEKWPTMVREEIEKRKHNKYGN